MGEGGRPWVRDQHLWDLRGVQAGFKGVSLVTRWMQGKTEEVPVPPRDGDLALSTLCRKGPPSFG